MKQSRLSQSSIIKPILTLEGQLKQLKAKIDKLTHENETLNTLLQSCEKQLETANKRKNLLHTMDVFK